MKRTTYAVVALLVGVLMAFASTAQAAPAPKTTGDIGYTAYSDVQRHLTFNAIQSETNVCGTFWNVEGVTSFTFEYQGAFYQHHVTLVQNGQSIVAPSGGGYPFSGGDAYHWNVTAGSVVGNTLSLTAVYDLGAIGTVMHITGAIAANGSISGSWDDNYGGYRTGTFTAPLGSAVAYATYCGKGTAYYSDASGLWYLVNVTAVSVAGDYAWFAGPVIASNFGAESNWLFAKVYDGGEPGTLVDNVWGSFATQSAALAGVGDHATPADGPFTITSGNLQVH